MQPQLNDPFVIYRQADRDYRKAEGISQSMLKEILASPAHFRARYGPEAEPFFPTAAMIQGTATHALILEPEEFDRQFYNRADKPKELTVAQIKEELEAQGIEFKKTAKKPELEELLYPDGKPVEKRTSLDESVFKEVYGAADALRSHDITGEWFCPGSKDFRKFNEVSLYVKHELGMTLKGRLDRMVVDTDLHTVNIYDLKTTKSAEPSEFVRSVVNLKYDLQAAFYVFLARNCFPGFEVNFYFVALERKTPHGIGVFRASDQLLTEGMRKMDKGLTLWASCSELNYWPGYDPIVHDLALPQWALGINSQPDAGEF